MSPEARVPDAGGTGAAALPVVGGRYEVGEPIGESHFYRVYRGRDLTMGRAVVVKVLQPEFSRDGEFSDRLRAESQSAISLSHANIAQSYEAWEENGHTFVITEFVRGINLKERIKRVAPFPLAVAIDIAIAVAEALDYASRAGFVHGDVRPENILISPEGQVKVTDFGTARAVAASTRIQMAALMESAHYLAPEVAQGKPLDGTADIYSLGVVIYEMLTGQVPFDADSPIAIAVKHLHDPPPPLRRQNAGVPKQVEAVVMKCLQKNPGTRYTTAGQLVQDLRGVREALRFGRPLDAAPEAVAAEPSRAPINPPIVRSRPAPPPAEVATGEPATRTLVLGMVGALLLIVAGFFLIQYMFLTAPKDVTVPNVMRVTEAEAQQKLQQAGLGMDVHGREYNDGVPDGTVYRMFPLAGSAVKQGKAVQVWVSKGPQPVVVPDLSGMALDKARRGIRNKGLVVGPVTSEYDETVPKGEVLAQNPAAGQEVRKLSSVSLVLSKGPEPPVQPEIVTPPESPETPTPAPDEQPHKRLFDVDVDMPADDKPSHALRVTVTDSKGEHEVVKETHKSGETVKKSVEAYGRSGEVTIRVYVDGELYKEDVR